MTATFTILGAPITKKNHARIIRNPRTGRPLLIQAAPAIAWEQSAVLQLRSQLSRAPSSLPVVMIPYFTRPVELAAVFYRARDVGDLGNFLAAACDALETAGVVSNDRLIRSFDGSRLAIDRKNPRVEIQISEMP